MGVRDQLDELAEGWAEPAPLEGKAEPGGGPLPAPPVLQPLLSRPSTAEREGMAQDELPAAPGAVQVGTLIALTDDGATPLVMMAGRPSGAALRARSVLDLHGAHIGREVVLAFEGGDVRRPIVLGVLRGTNEGLPQDAPKAQFELDADGERLLVTAQSQLVLRCGKASITLTRAGKVLIEGSYLSSRSSGVNRIKGGSVQLN